MSIPCIVACGRYHRHPAKRENLGHRAALQPSAGGSGLWMRGATAFAAATRRPRSPFARGCRAEASHIAGGAGREDAGARPPLEFGPHAVLEVAHPLVQLLHAVLELEDAHDGRKPDAVGGHARDFAQLLDVPQRVPAGTALGAGGHHQAQPVV